MQKNFLWAFLVAMMIMVMGCFPKLDPPKGGDSADETGQIDSGETGETGDPCPDADGDGHEDIVCGGTDCDDTVATVNPDAVEACNGIDDNCNGSTDEDQEFLDWYADADSDGYGAGAATSTCNGPPAGFVESDSDCDDSDPSVYPSAPEDCTASVDMNCDGSAGADDADSDGYRSCEDCDDTNPDANPGEVEVCDSAKVDEDCDGSADDEDADVTGTSTWYYDGGDHDGYGIESVSIEACNEVADYVEVAGDCDDAVSTVNPGAQEVCDSADTDEDCDGLADDLDDSVTGTSTWYEDDDHDGFGDSAAATTACDIPTADHVTNGADCDDAESAVNPGTPETCDSVDNNCDSSVDEGGVCADTGGDTGSDTGGDTGDTGGSSGGTLVEITFGDGGTCSADPFTDGGGGSIPSSMIYSDGGGTCGVHIYGSGSSSAPSGTKELLTTVTGLTSSTPYEVELELENTLPSTAVTVYSSFGGGTVSSVSVSGSSTDSLIFSFTASATEGDLEVWSGASTDYDVVVHSVTITY